MIGNANDLQAALAPGADLRLAAGRFAEPVTIVQSGLVLRGSDGSEFWRAGLILRDVQDVIVENITFRQSPASSIVLEGACRNVTIRNCRFFACGFPGGGVTVWLGEGVRDCSISYCEFDMLGLEAERHLRPSHCHDIAIMCHQRDCTGHQFVGNVVRHYCYGLQLGCAGTCREEGRHLVRDNRIIVPRADGIHVKQAHCEVIGNTVIGGRRFGMSARAGFGSSFVGNRVEDCGVGIRILGEGHRVCDNHLLRCRRAGIWLRAAKADGDGFAAADTEVQGNHLIDCGGLDAQAEAGDKPCAGIVSGSPEPQRLGENFIVGSGTALLELGGVDRD